MVDNKRCVSMSKWKCDHNESFSMRFSGTENDLNHILSTFEDSENEIENFFTSNYVAMTDTQSIFTKWTK